MTPSEKEKRQEWATPDDVWKKINGVWNFQLDACASLENTKCPAFYGKAADSLSDDCPWVTEHHWRVYCNPGFGKMMPWIEKAITEYQKRSDSVVVVMGKSDQSTKWYKRAQEHCFVVNLAGPRVQFESPEDINATSNNHCNSLFVFGGPPIVSLGKHIKTNIANWYWRE